MGGFKEMYEHMPEIKTYLDRMNDAIDTLTKEINMIEYYIDRNKYYDEPVTIEHLIEINKELHRIIRILDN